MKKYELTENKKEIFGTTLYQIKALIDIPVFGVKKGDLGGWIEKEDNLSHDGDCWVGGNACVYYKALVLDNALVSGDARISGNAYVYDNAQVFDNALVLDNALVSGDARVSGNACVYEKAKVSGSTCVYGDARVFGNACVFGNAQVLNRALVSGNAIVSGNAFVFGNVKISDNLRISGNAQIAKQEDIFYASSVGSENGILIAYKNLDGSIQMLRGCFNGTLEEFEEAVKIKHSGTKYEKEYLTLIDFIRYRFGV